MYKKDFLNLVETFLDKAGISAANLGIRAARDSSLILKMRRGRECREATQEKVLNFMKKYAAEHQINFDFEEKRQ